MDAKPDELLSKMTLEEKVSLLAGADFWHSVPIERLGVPAIKVTDGPLGARGAEGSMAPPSACFPAGVALASTWNPELVEETGAALGEETRAKGAHILLAPTVNIHRSPLAGRNFECYSEDPYLTGRMAVAYINGLQSQGVGACIKHFVCNDSEFERNSISSEIDERPLREIYLAPFLTAIKEAHPWSVMSAYNKVNGVYCSENSYLLRDILKGEWEFDGLVISDWYGSYSPGAAPGGLDLEMPGPARWMGQAVAQAVKLGKVSEADIDDKVRRILRTIERVGGFDNPQLQPEQSIDRPEHRKIAFQAAAEAIVLLKNTSDLLPLDAAKIRRIAVIGTPAQRPLVQGGGSARVTPHYTSAPLTAIREKCAGNARITYKPGCTFYKTAPLLELEWLLEQPGERKGYHIELFDNPKLEGEPLLTRFTDRSEITWTDTFIHGVPPASFSARITAQLSVPESGEYTFSLMSNGQTRLYLGDDLVVDLWQSEFVGATPWDNPEQTGVAHLKAGEIYELRLDFSYQRESPWRILRIGCQAPTPEDSIERSVEAAQNADVALVFVGLGEEYDSEGFDRPDMELPGEQVELVRRVCAANPRTVVILNCGAPVKMDWLEQAAGVLMAWYGGQEGGNAVASVLFGEVNPSGKLPTSFPKRLEDNPAYINYPGENGRVRYGEGLFVGYRYYDKKDVEPRFPFGYGLSYTTFEYDNLEISPEITLEGQGVRVSLEVHNSGARTGKEVVQLYLSDPDCKLARPEKELKGFAKVALEPGETKKVSFLVNSQSLAYYDDAQRAWVSEPGVFEALVGSSSRHIHLRGSFEWKA